MTPRRDLEAEMWAAVRKSDELVPVAFLGTVCGFVLAIAGGAAFGMMFIRSSFGWYLLFAIVGTIPGWVFAWWSTRPYFAAYKKAWAAVRALKDATRRST